MREDAAIGPFFLELYLEDLAKTPLVFLLQCCEVPAAGPNL